MTSKAKIDPAIGVAGGTNQTTQCEVSVPSELAQCRGVLTFGGLKKMSCL